MEYSTSVELGKRIGYKEGEAVVLTTDAWEGVVGSKGGRGKIDYFAGEAGETFAYVRMDSTPNGGQSFPFPFLPGEFERAEAGE